MCCSEACIGLVELVAVNVRIVHAWLHIWDITFASLDSICSNQCAVPYNMEQSNRGLFIGRGGLEKIMNREQCLLLWL